MNLGYPVHEAWQREDKKRKDKTETSLDAYELQTDIPRYCKNEPIACKRQANNGAN